MRELDYLEKQLTEATQTRVLTISDGNVPDYVAYRQIVGEIRGLSLAVREIEDLRKRLTEADNV